MIGYAFAILSIRYIYIDESSTTMRHFILAMCLGLVAVPAQARYESGGGGYGVFVRGYVRSNGTYVAPYHRALPYWGRQTPILAGGRYSNASGAAGPVLQGGLVPANGGTAAMPEQPYPPEKAWCADGKIVGTGRGICVLN